jgi:hypothetical protein
VVEQDVGVFEKPTRYDEGKGDADQAAFGGDGE